MPKGQRQTRNPVERLFAVSSMLENVVQSVLDSADNPTFASSIIEFRKKREEEESKKSNLNKDAREVMKLLQTYPGLSKQTLGHLRSKIAEYKDLDIIEKYKIDSESIEKQKGEEKKITK